jgi:transposase, IS30 family
LAQGCSPEQIAGRLRRADPDDMQRQLSAETIYVSLYVLSLRRALQAVLRQGARRARLGLGGWIDWGQLPHMTPNWRVHRRRGHPHGPRPLGR